MTGDTCLNEEVVTTYFNTMTETVGFLNGYAPSFSFQHDNGGNGQNRSLVSFDYYLDPARSVQRTFHVSLPCPQHSQHSQHSHPLTPLKCYLFPAEAISDLNDLAALNAKRPYYLAIHVREFSTVGKVIEIVNGLDPAVFEIAPVDDFFNLANALPTWQDKMTNE